MKIWIDAQLSPAIATWLKEEFEVEATAVRDVGLERAKDPEIFGAARRENAVVMTKDSDFVRMLERNGPPPQVLWITCGNTSNQALQRILRSTFDDALNLLREGEAMVEISDSQ